MSSYDPDLQPILDAIMARLTALETAPPVDLAPLLARIAALEPVPAPDVRGWMAVNIQMHPYDLIAADRAAGYDRPAEYHRLAHLAHAEAPSRMTQPQPPMADIMALLGDDNGLILRDFVNQWQYDEEGTMLEPAHQRMLEEWVAAGGRLQFVHAWLGQEDWPNPVKAAGPDARRVYLRNVAGTVCEGWRRCGLWYARQSPEVQAAVVALETFNEPAIYDKAIKQGLLDRRAIIDLFVADQIRIAREGMGWWDGPVMAALFAYSARTGELTEPDATGVSGIARIREAIGKRLIWSAHRYPGWVKGKTPEAWKAALLAGLEPLHPDPVVITEANADLTADPASAGYQAARVWGEIAAMGYGLGWFSGVNYGGGPLVNFGGKRGPEVRNIDRLAVFHDAATATNREASTVLTPFRVLRSRLDKRGGADDALLRVVGAPGGDTIAPTEPAATLIYGNAGDDSITINPNAATWVFGGPGNDSIDARVGPFAIVVLGDGDDTIRLGAEQVYVYGGGGSDRFVLAGTGTAIIDNFNPASDVLDAGGLPVTAAVDGNDLVLTIGTGTTRLLGITQTPPIL